jgi:hypothetical protein
MLAPICLFEPGGIMKMSKIGYAYLQKLESELAEKGELVIYEPERAVIQLLVKNNAKVFSDRLLVYLSLEGIC